MKRCALFSCRGLGDGLIALVLSHNLRLAGWEVDTFHPFLHGLQSWFPGLPMAPFPPLSLLTLYERFYLFYEKTPWMEAVLRYAESAFPEKTFVLNPIATSNRDYPYWEVGRFDGRRSFVENLVRFAAEHLGTSAVACENGIRLPEGVERGRWHQRVVIHPTSSRPGKNWPAAQFLRLAELLEAEGYAPHFLLTEEEAVDWPASRFPVPALASLSDRAAFIAESGGMIGNDSGVGHLASCLGLPTVTLCRSRKNATFWRPAFSSGGVLTPPAWIPNIKGARLRDRYWKEWISPSAVLRLFLVVMHKAKGDLHQEAAGAHIAGVAKDKAIT